MPVDANINYSFTLPAAAITAAAAAWPFYATGGGTRATFDRVPSQENTMGGIDQIIAAIERKVDRTEGRVDGIKDTLARMEGTLGRLETGMTHVATKDALTKVDSDSRDRDRTTWISILGATITVLIAVVGFGVTLLLRTTPAALREALAPGAVPAAVAPVQPAASAPAPAAAAVPER